ncbi:hypothetical protein F-VV57_0198 [Faustovirus]|nr:hypothetical protein F-VV57_0198 [Faustovirus]QJX73465.1 hypothetical protein F-VV63_0199 [Faustovirus]
MKRYQTTDIYGRTRPPLAPENIMVVTFGMIDIVNIIADFIEHNQIINVLRGVCWWTRTALARYRGYSLIDYFVHCRLNFEAPLWALITHKLTNNEGLQYHPTCGYGVGMDRIATKIYQSILEYDAAEYARMCGLNLNYEFEADVIIGDKWRLFAATVNVDNLYIHRILQYRPREIIRRLPQICMRGCGNSYRYVDGVRIFRYDDLKGGIAVLEQCKRLCRYPVNFHIKMVVSISHTTADMHEHAKMYAEYNDSGLFTNKLSLLDIAITYTTCELQFLRLGKFLLCLEQYMDILDKFANYHVKYNNMLNMNVTVGELRQFLADLDTI